MDDSSYESVSRASRTSRTGRSRRGRRTLGSLALCALLAAALVGAPGAAWASDSGKMSKQASLGFGSAVASLIYTPVKLCYAVGGLVVGGLAWAFSGGDSEVANVVLTPSILGDYVLTPDHLVGDKSIEFFGRDPDYIPEEIDVAASPSSASSDFETQDYDQSW